VVAVSDDDDDWFERALREDDEEATEGSGESSDDGTATPEKPAADEEDTPGTGDAGSDTDGTAATSDGPTAGPGSGGSDTDDGSGASDDNGGGPFEQDFTSALENAPDPDVGSGQSQPGGGTGQGGGSPCGGGQEGSGSPFGGGDGDDEFGFGDFGGEEPESFDETEDFESDLDRFDVGIDGLDQMILGGVPRRSLMVAIGSAGTGKTTFGLQFLHHGLQQGEDAVYITLEESYDRIVSTANEKGWGFGEYADEDRLAVIDIDPIEMANSLDSIQNDLPNLIEDFGADRLVLDSVSLLEMMYESAPKRRSQVFGFARSLKEAGITILLTSEADRNHAYASRFGIVEYLADAVFVLQYVRPSDFRETRLAIEIQKIRDANHSRETKPYDLTDEGISVYRQANIF
jgi:KaiC domain protein